MPRVPLYREQETLRPLPNARVRAAGTGDALRDVGAGLQNAGGALGAAAARDQERLNASRVFEAEAALQDEYLQFETAQRDRRGSKAIGITGDVDKWFEQAGQRHGKALENDAQRFLFDQTAAQLRQRSLQSATRYESQERRVALETSAAAAIDGFINTAAASYADPEAIADVKDSALKRVRVQAEFNGWTPERRAAAESETLTAMHAAVLQAMVDADPAGAREYYKTNREEIAGASRAKLKELIDAGTLRAKAQDATDRIAGKGLPEADALAAARKISDPEERDEVVSRVKVRYREADAARVERERQLADQAWDIFARTGKVSSLPTPLLDELDGRTLQAMKNAESGEEIEDWNYFYTMLQDAREDPEAFAQRDLRQDFPSLSTSQRGQVTSLQEQLREPAKLPDAGTLVQQINVAEQLLALDKPEDKGKFEFAVRQGVAAFIQQTGKEPSYDERQVIIDRLMIQGDIPGIFFGRSRRLYEVTGTEGEAEFTPEVPDADRDQIIDALTRNGMPVSDEIVLEIYRAAKGL